MKNKIFNVSNTVINVLFAVFIFIGLYFALISRNLLLKSEHTNAVTLGMLAVILCFALAYGYFDRLRLFLKRLFVNWRFYTAPLLFICALGLQTYFVWHVHPAIGFDVSAVHNALLNPNYPEWRGYFSVNYNNMPILLFQYWLSNLFHTKSWLFFEIVSVLFTDLSAIFNLGSVAVVNWRKLPIILYIEAIWLALYPMAIVSYTDNWSLPFVSLYILCYLIMSRQSWPLVIRLIAGALGGFGLAGAYLLKPSAIIPMIALVLISLLALLKKRPVSFWVKSGLSFIVMIGVFAGTAVQINKAMDQQTYIVVDKKRAIPPLHFIQIGMTGDGGYSAKDALMMGKLYSRQEKNAYSMRKIKQTLRQRGIGYAGFLVAKHGRNTADGTFSWLLEGHFFVNKADNKRVKSGIASFVYPKGDNVDNYRFVAQIAWIIMLFLIAFGWQEQRLVVQAMRLGMIGGFIFLLFFEGGRSRYLIQFLPLLFIMATFCSQAATSKLHSIFSWSHNQRKE